MKGVCIMYKINIKNHLDILSINSLCWGIENDIIAPEFAIEYANEYLNKNSDCDNSKLIDLLILDDCTKDNVLEIINNESNKRNDEKEKRIIRYVILQDIFEKTDDAEKLFELIESVYADFGYPADMDNFIPYMPAEDEAEISEYTGFERTQHLLCNFQSFLKKEYICIKQILKRY